jgi:hypothetical protein
MEIVVNDLSRGGAEIARLTLPEVRAGWWWSERAINGQHIPAHLMPGAALSPDRRELALAHADDDAVTMVDLEQLNVARTLAAQRPRTWAQTLAAQLGLAPRTAHAKSMDGHTRGARFTPDGRRLLVWGAETRAEPSGGISERAAPLRLIDVAQGQLLGQVALEAGFPEILLAPDGRSLYVGSAPRGRFAPATPSPGQEKPGYVLRRLDATSFAVLAQREVRGEFGGLYGAWSSWLDPPGYLTTS